MKNIEVGGLILGCFFAPFLVGWLLAGDNGVLVALWLYIALLVGLVLIGLAYTIGDVIRGGRWW